MTFTDGARVTKRLNGCLYKYVRLRSAR